MAEYYVIRDKNTGLYFRGKGVNRWGKHYNQASIYRVKGMAENTVKEVAWKGERAEIVPIQIVETSNDVAEVRYGKWIKATPHSQEYCNQCGLTPKMIFGILPDFCPNCGAKMNGGKDGRD